MDQVKHIFFDLDRTLWDFEANSRRVITDLFHEHNLSSRCNTDAESFINTYEKVNAHLWEQLRKAVINKEQLRRSRFYNTMNFFGYSDRETALKLEEAYVTISPYQTQLIEGTLQTLQILKEKYVLHIITNGFKEVQHIKLSQCGIRNYFEHVIISEEVGFSKPDRKIFEYALDKSKCEAREALMIGDDFEADVTGALNAGWHAIHFDITKSSKGNCVSHLTEIPTLLSPQKKPL